MGRDRAIFRLHGRDQSKTGMDAGFSRLAHGCACLRLVRQRKRSMKPKITGPSPGPLSSSACLTPLRETYLPTRPHIHIKIRKGGENTTKTKRLNMAALAVLFALGAYVLFRAAVVFHRTDFGGSGYGLAYRLQNSLQKYVVDTYAPSLLYGVRDEEPVIDYAQYILEMAQKGIPLQEYMKEKNGYIREVESADTYEAILQQEAADENEVADNGDVIHAEGAVAVEDTLTKAIEENEKAAETGDLIHRQRQVQFDLDELTDFDNLVSHFYAIDKTTEISEDKLNITDLMGKDMTLRGDAGKPQILIYHTHSQEGFLDSIPGDAATSIVGVGERLAGLLRDEYGYNVIHHTGEYDKESRDYAYSNAGPAIEKILAENPTIEVVIDLHRDGVADDRRLVTDVDGVTMAQFMFFNGLSHTKKIGDIDYLPNPYIEDNLALAFQLQLKMSEYYPNLARKIYLKGYRYNMHYRDKSLLIEVGAQTNTVEEVMNTMTPLAYILDMVLSGKEETAIITNSD